MERGLRDVLGRLAEERPVFHSEADFQHALALEIHRSQPETALRLERRPNNPESRIYVDVWLERDGTATALELKYKTRQLETPVNREQFRLLNQSAQDIARYDFVKDIARLERLTGSGEVNSAFAIFLTNDRSYWSPAGRPDTVDAAFRIHEGQRLEGTLDWSERASAGTKRSREDPLLLRGTYTLRWSNYARLACSNGAFRYLLVAI